MPSRSHLLAILVFLLVGPPLGLLIVYAAEPALWESINVFAMVALGYLFGGMPAFTAGACYVLVWPLMAGLPIRSARMLGCLTGLAGSVPLLVWLAGQSTNSLPMAPYFLFMLPAAVCGTLAARLLDTRQQA